MGHRVIAAVAAVSVFFHTGMGCCAHHVHADQHRMLSASSQVDDDWDCCKACPNHATHRHRARRSNDGCRIGSDMEALADGPQRHGPHGCPGEGSSRCAEQSCSFWVPESPAVPVLDDSAGVIVAVVKVSLGSQSLVQPSTTNGSPWISAPFSVGTLRQHLALSVLLI